MKKLEYVSDEESDFGGAKLNSASPKKEVIRDVIISDSEGEENDE